jgi:predicted nucleotidyltransferase
MRCPVHEPPSRACLAPSVVIHPRERPPRPAHPAFRQPFYTCPVIPALIEELRRVLETGPPLRLAVLFGSGARRGLRADSDLDIGIVPRDPDLSLAAELDLQARLERVSRRHVDLVRLDAASTLLRWEAARHAVLILADRPGELSRFVAAAALEHADFILAFDLSAERFRQRLLALPTGASRT